MGRATVFTAQTTIHFINSKTVSANAFTMELNLTILGECVCVCECEAVVHVFFR